MCHPQDHCLSWGWKQGYIAHHKSGLQNGQGKNEVKLNIICQERKKWSTRNGRRESEGLGWLLPCSNQVELPHDPEVWAVGKHSPWEKRKKDTGWNGSCWKLMWCCWSISQPVSPWFGKAEGKAHCSCLCCSWDWSANQRDCSGGPVEIKFPETIKQTFYILNHPLCLLVEAVWTINLSGKGPFPPVLAEHQHSEISP